MAQEQVQVDLQPSPHGFGVGLVVGDPTGLSWMWRPGNDHAIQGALAWSVRGDDLHANVDYLFYPWVLRANEAPTISFPVYVGIGGFARMGDHGWRWDDDHYGALGVRIPVGITLLPSRVPFDVFFELVPAVSLYPSTDVDLLGGLGGRVFLFR